MLREQGTSNTRILKYLNRENERYYRFVGQSEFDKIMSGERVSSDRPCRNGIQTDVTSNPEYDQIPTIGKYRIKFKDKPEFNIFSNNKDSQRIFENDYGQCTFLLKGGYSLADIEKIEFKTAPYSYETVWKSNN